MNTLGKIDYDLLLLLKCHYGAFNDQNKYELIARMLAHHYLVPIDVARRRDMQAHVLTQLLLKVRPEIAGPDGAPHLLIDLICKFAKDPVRGMDELVGLISMCPAYKGVVQILELPKIDAMMKVILETDPDKEPA